MKKDRIFTANMTANEREYQYAKIRERADSIIQGRGRISCLASGAESGRIKGGRRNVEASILIGGDESTGDPSTTKILKKLQEVKLENWANHEKIWFDHFDIVNNWKRIDNGRSMEAEVYGFEKTQTVRKVFHYDAIDSNTIPMDFINNRISVHNHLFPETKYTLLGFTRSNAGFRYERFAFVLEQPYIQGKPMTEKEIEAFMKSIGFPAHSGTYYWNDYFIVGDMHEGNILKFTDEKGNDLVFVIDPMPKLNTSIALGGKSAYFPFSIVEDKL